MLYSIIYVFCLYTLTYVFNEIKQPKQRKIPFQSMTTKRTVCLSFHLICECKLYKFLLLYSGIPIKYKFRDIWKAPFFSWFFIFFFYTPKMNKMNKCLVCPNSPPPYLKSIIIDVWNELYFEYQSMCLN